MKAAVPDFGDVDYAVADEGIFLWEVSLQEFIYKYQILL